MKLPLFALVLTALAFSLAASAETDLSREVRNAQAKHQQQDRQSQAQAAANRNTARRKAVAATLAAKGLKAVTVESAGRNDFHELVNVKLADGRVCQATVDDNGFISQKDESDSNSVLADQIAMIRRQLGIAQRLADREQTRRALKRLADSAFLDEMQEGLRGAELNILARRLDAFALEADILDVDAVVSCFSADGSAQEIVGHAMANKNGAVLENGF